MPSYPWFKVDTAGWIRGSIRADMTIEQRSVWIDLLAMAADCRPRDGTLRYAEGKPIPRGQIAQLLGIPLDLLNETIEICSEDKNRDNERHRIEVWEDGTIQIVNWEHYQHVPYLRRAKEDSMSKKLREIRRLRMDVQGNPEMAVEALQEILPEGDGEANHA